MSIIVSNLRIGIDQSNDVAIYAAYKKLRIKSDMVKKTEVYKKSLDARKKTNPTFVMSLMIDLFENEAEIVKAAADSSVILHEKPQLEFKVGTEPLENPIIIIGFGPAGIFAAHTLASLGYRPIVFEKGGDVDSRVEAVNDFWLHGRLNAQSNVQFGEGGAGTFSDGKLTTRISDSRCDYILEQLVKNGAPKEILSTAKPHIGTDKLRGVIKAMRKDIIKKGGRVYFNKNLQDIIIENNAVHAVIVDNQEIRTDNLILAVGHSSREVFSMLLKKQVAVEAKSFSVGVRIEQLQATINKGLYGDLSEHKELQKGDYQLSHKCGDRCVYTFCMCPGGFVVPSSSTIDSVVTNGMSEHSRDGANANSALVVSVSPADFGKNPLSGVEFQQQLEQLAYKKAGGNYKAPAMTVNEFMSGSGTLNLKNVEPSYSLGVTGVNFGEIFPDYITKMLRMGLQVFDSKLKGFAAGDGVLTGVETRTSSPIRILRNSEFTSITTKGLYPCGEGAGYAGGIISAAIDGINIAQHLISQYKSEPPRIIPRTSAKEKETIESADNN